MQFAIDLARQDYLMRTNRVTSSEKQQIQNRQPGRKTTTTDKAAAFLAGAAIAGIVSNLKQMNTRFFLTAMEHISNPPSLEETRVAADKVSEAMGLKKLGVKVFFAENTAEDHAKLSGIIKNNLMNNFKNFIPKKSELVQNIISTYCDTKATMIINGQKASYFAHDKVVAISPKVSPSVFHELGQAKVTESKLKKLLTVGKYLPYASIGLGVLTLLHTPHRKKPASQKSFGEKAKDFLDNNIEVITFLSYMPHFVGKSIANHSAWRETKKILPKPQMNSIRKLYSVGLVTFLATAVASSVGINIGNRVQNNIIRQKNSPQDVYNLLI